MNRKLCKIQGLTMLESVIVLSVIATLSAFSVPQISTARREAQLTRCAAQLHEVGVAIQQYRNDHSGRLPGSMRQLVPRYVAEDQLICPLVRTVAPQLVAERRQKTSARGAIWHTYFLFSQRGLDDLKVRLQRESGFSDVFKERGDDTPVVICPDHREPRSLNPLLGFSGPARDSTGATLDPAAFPSWEYPEEPVLVLRYDGHVARSHKGGLRSRGTAVSTMHELQTL